MKLMIPNHFDLETNKTSQPIKQQCRMTQLPDSTKPTPAVVITCLTLVRATLPSLIARLCQRRPIILFFIQSFF